MKRTISVCVRHSDRMIVSRAIIGMPYAPLMIRTHSAIFDFHLLAVRTLSAHHQTHGTKIVPMSVKIAPMSQSPPQNAWTRIHQSTRPVVTNTLFTVIFFMVSLLPYGQLCPYDYFLLPVSTNSSSSGWLSQSQSIETLSSAAMRRRYSIDGSLKPLSRNEYDVCEMPIFFATSRCDILALIRAVFKRSQNNFRASFLSKITM